MKKQYLLIISILLFITFVVYANSGIRFSGPIDKAVQLFLLVPAIFLSALFVAEYSKRDFLKEFWLRIERVSSRNFLVWIFLSVFCVMLYIAIWPLEGIPKGGDEAAYLFQSRIFAAGQTTAPMPLAEDSRDLFPFRHFIFKDNSWFVMYTPLHAILLIPFTSLNLSYLLGPLESVLALLGAFFLIRRLAGERYARLSVIVMSLSPFFLFMGASHMAHNSNLLFVTWSLYFLVRGVQEKSILFQLLCGFLLGLALNTKPYPIIPWALTITLTLFVKYRLGAFKILFSIALGSLLPVVFLLLSNKHYTGDFFSPAYNLARGGGLIGFGEGKAWFPEYGDNAHTPLRGIYNLIKQAGTGSTILLGWPFLSLIPATIVIFNKEFRKKVWPAVIALLMLPPFMFIHYSASIDYGPRHYYTTLPAFAFLTVLGFVLLNRKWGKRASYTIAGLFVVTLLVYIPDGIRLRSTPWQSIDNLPLELAEKNVELPAVVFMEASEHGYPNIMSGLLATDPFLQGDIIFCAHQTTEEDLFHIQHLFAGRHAYLFYMEDRNGFIEPWSASLANSLIAERELRPAWVPENLPQAGN